MKKINEEKIIIRKNGNFYHVFDDDAIIMWSLFGYKISNRKVGFPKSVYEKVKNTLEDNHIHYLAIISDTEEEKFNKGKNEYKRALKYAKDKMSKNSKIEKIYQKLDKLDEEQFDRIIDFIEGVMNE